MKATLLLAAAFALTTSAALAQTVAPGTAPGAQTGNPSNMPSAGTPANTDRISTNSDRTDNPSGSGRSDKRTMPKNGKIKTTSSGSKAKMKM